MKIEDFAMLTPMKYYNNETDCPKRQAMINNADNAYMATVKKDGDWAMLIHYSKGNNLIRSRSISKVTGVYGDYTAKLPHICNEMDMLPDNTVLLAEICWDEPGTNANTVGTILRCLPEKAVERQKEKKLKALVFDILMCNNEDMSNYRYEARFSNADYLFNESNLPKLSYIYMTQLCELDSEHENFLEWADEIIRNGGEGLVIQKKSNPYMPGTRTAWATLKLKQKMESAEYPIIGTLEPNALYEGICEETWKYWYFTDENGTYYINRDFEEPFYQDVLAKGIKLTPITKPYYYGWKNGITIMLPSGITCDVASGMTDELREWLGTEEAQEMIRCGDLYAEVAAMSINDLGRLRHPYIVKIRSKESGANEK